MNATLWPETEESLAGTAFDENGVLRTRPLPQYERDPIGFLRDILEIPEHTLRWSLNGYAKHQWDGTEDPLAVAANALADWENVGIESATGTGKSFLAAGLILWFVGSFEPARVFTFAPKEDQLRLYIWAEMAKLWPAFQRHFPGATCGDLWVSMDGTDTWGAWGYAVGVRAGETVATKAAGMHSKHLLLVYEETPGINLAVLEAGAQTCVAPHNLRLALGNPDSQDDALHRFCTLPNVRAIRVSALDHPNVVCDNPDIVPGAVSLKSVLERKLKDGETSFLYESRVRGISPAQATDALIQRSWCEAAIARYNDGALRNGPRAWGVDVANSENGDKGAVARWLGRCLLEVDAKPCPDANVLGSQVVEEVKRLNGRASHVGIDSVGVGAGAVNECKRLSFRVQALNGGARAIPTFDGERDVEDDRKQTRNEEKFANLRAAMWWQMREDLRLGRIALPNDKDLIQDLVTPKWETKGGKIIVEPKEEIKLRLGHSPDKGDAAVYGNWVRDRTRDKTPDTINDYDPDPKGEIRQQHAELTATLGGRKRVAELIQGRRRSWGNGNDGGSGPPPDDMFGDF